MTRTGSKRRSSASNRVAGRKVSGGGGLVSVEADRTGRKQTTTSNNANRSHRTLDGTPPRAELRKNRRQSGRGDDDVRNGLDTQWSKATLAAADRGSVLKTTSQVSDGEQ